MRLFLDTGPLLAYVNPKDKLHKSALDLFDRLADREWRRAYTSDFVVAEALNYIQARVHRRAAAEAVLDIAFGGPASRAFVAEVLRVHAGRFAAAVDLYRRRFERGLSLTDCTTLVLAEELRIDAIATFDGAFRGSAHVVP